MPPLQFFIDLFYSCAFENFKIEPVIIIGVRNVATLLPEVGASDAPSLSVIAAKPITLMQHVRDNVAWALARHAGLPKDYIGRLAVVHDIAINKELDQYAFEGICPLLIQWQFMIVSLHLTMNLMSS